VPPIDNDPDPLITWFCPGVHVIDSELTVMPVTNVKLLALMVYVPLVVPELFVIVPEALKLLVPPNSEILPDAVKVQLLLSVYEPERLSVEPPIDNEAEPLITWFCPGVHVIDSELTVMPVAIVKLAALIVYVPLVVPELFAIVPEALSVPPKSEMFPVAAKVQLRLLV